MKRIMQCLASTGVIHEGEYFQPLGDVGEYVDYTKGKLDKLHIGTPGSPLATLHPKGVQIGKHVFEVPINTIQTKIESKFMEFIRRYWPRFMNNGNIHTYIDYGLSGVFSSIPMTQEFPGEISLNHMGVCINTNQREEFVQKLLSALSDSEHTLYEDPAGREEEMIWLFIGDKDSDKPMFEIVLPSPELNMNNHFQIDVDTDASQECLDKFFAEKFNGKDIFDWELEIDGVGKVLQMGTIGNTDGIDFRLGIGNNKRSKKAHRDSMVEIS